MNIEKPLHTLRWTDLPRLCDYPLLSLWGISFWIAPCFPIGPEIDNQSHLLYLNPEPGQSKLADYGTDLVFYKDPYLDEES